MAQQDKTTFKIAISLAKHREFDWYGYTIDEPEISTDDVSAENLRLNHTNKKALNITLSKNQSGASIDFIATTVGEPVGDIINNYTTFMNNNFNSSITYDKNSINIKFPKYQDYTKIIEWENSSYIKDILTYKQAAKQTNTPFSKFWMPNVISLSSATLAKYLKKHDLLYLNIKDFKFYHKDTHQLYADRVPEHSSIRPSDSKSELFEPMDVNTTTGIRRSIYDFPYRGGNMHYITHQISQREITNYIRRESGISGITSVKKFYWINLTEDEKVLLLLKYSILKPYVTSFSKRIFRINNIDYKLLFNKQCFLDVANNTEVESIPIYKEENGNKVIDYFIWFDNLNEVLQHYINNYIQEDTKIFNCINNNTHLTNPEVSKYFEEPYLYDKQVSDIGYWYNPITEHIYNENLYNLNKEPSSIYSRYSNKDEPGTLADRLVTNGEFLSSQEIEDTGSFRVKVGGFRLSPGIFKDDKSNTSIIGYTNIGNNIVNKFDLGNNQIGYTKDTLTDTLLDTFDYYKSVYISQGIWKNNSKNLINYINNKFYYYYFNQLDVNTDDENYDVYTFEPILILPDFRQNIVCPIREYILQVNKKEVLDPNTQGVYKDNEGNYYILTTTSKSSTSYDVNIECPTLYPKSNIQIKVSNELKNKISDFEDLRDTWLIKHIGTDIDGSTFEDISFYTKPTKEIINEFNVGINRYCKTLPYLLFGSYHTSIKAYWGIVWGLISAIGWIISWFDRKNKEKYTRNFHVLGINKENAIWFHSHDKKASLIYYKKLLGTDLRTMDKRENPDYQDLPYKVNNKKGKLSRLYTDDDLPFYIPKILQKTNSSNSDFQEYLKESGNNFMYHLYLSSRFTFMIYLNKSIRHNKMLSKMGMMIIKWYLDRYNQPDNVEMIVETYPNDRTQYEEKRKFLLIKRERYVLDDTNKKPYRYWCDYDSSTSTLLFHDQSTRYRYTLDLDYYYPNYKSYFAIDKGNNSKENIQYSLRTGNYEKFNFNPLKVYKAATYKFTDDHKSINTWITNPKTADRTFYSPYYGINIDCRYYKNNKIQTITTNIDFSNSEFTLFMPPRYFVNDDELEDRVKNSLNNVNVITYMKKLLETISSKELMEKYIYFMNEYVSLTEDLTYPFNPNKIFDLFNDNEYLNYDIFKNPNIKYYPISSSVIDLKYGDTGKTDSCLTMLPDKSVGNVDINYSISNDTDLSGSVYSIGRFTTKEEVELKYNFKFPYSEEYRKKYFIDILNSQHEDIDYHNVVDSYVKKLKYFESIPDKKDYLFGNIIGCMPITYHSDLNYSYGIDKYPQLATNTKIFGLNTNNIPILNFRYFHSIYNSKYLVSNNFTTNITQVQWFNIFNILDTMTDDEIIKLLEDFVKDATIEPEPEPEATKLELSQSYIECLVGKEYYIDITTNANTFQYLDLTPNKITYRQDGFRLYFTPNIEGYAYVNIVAQYKNYLPSYKRLTINVKPAVTRQNLIHILKYGIKKSEKSMLIINIGSIENPNNPNEGIQYNLDNITTQNNQLNITKVEGDSLKELLFNNIWGDNPLFKDVNNSVSIYSLEWDENAIKDDIVDITISHPLTNEKYNYSYTIELLNETEFWLKPSVSEINTTIDKVQDISFTIETEINHFNGMDYSKVTGKELAQALGFNSTYCFEVKSAEKIYLSLTNSYSGVRLKCQMGLNLAQLDWIKYQIQYGQIYTFDNIFKIDENNQINIQLKFPEDTIITKVTPFRAKRAVRKTISYIDSVTIDLLLFYLKNKPRQYKDRLQEIVNLYINNNLEGLKQYPKALGSIIFKSEAIDNLIQKVLLDYFPSQNIISPDDWLATFKKGYMNKEQSHILTLFTEDEWYDIGQIHVMVNPSKENATEDNVPFYKIIEECNNFVRITNNELSKHNPYATYAYINVPFEIYKRMPHYCKSFLFKILGTFESHYISPIPCWDKISTRWQMAQVIINAIVQIIIALAIGMYVPQLGIIMIISAILMIIKLGLDILMFFVPFTEQHKYQVFYKVIAAAQFVLSIVSLGMGGLGSINSIINFTLTIVNYAIQAANYIVKYVQNQKLKELENEQNLLQNNLDKLKEDQSDFLEENEFMNGMLTYKPLNMDLKYQKLDIFDTIYYPYETPEAVFTFEETKLEEFYTKPFE